MFQVVKYLFWTAPRFRSPSSKRFKSGVLFSSPSAIINIMKEAFVWSLMKKQYGRSFSHFLRRGSQVNLGGHRHYAKSSSYEDKLLEHQRRRGEMKVLSVCVCFIIEEPLILLLKLKRPPDKLSEALLRLHDMNDSISRNQISISSLYRLLRDARWWERTRMKKMMIVMYAQLPLAIVPIIFL